MAVLKKAVDSWLMVPLAVFLLTAGGCEAQNLIDPFPRSCRILQSVGSPIAQQDVTTTVNEYPAGGILMALASVPANVNGVFTFYLCTADGNTDEEECLVKIPLQLADGSGTQFDMSKVTKADKYEIPVRLPDDITCDRCTLQWRVVMKQCDDTDSCNYIDDFFCTDIAVRQPKDSEKRFFHIIGGLLSKVFG